MLHKTSASQCPIFMVLYLCRMLQWRVTRGATFGCRLFTYSPPRCRSLQDHKTFIPLLESLWNDLADPVFDSV